MRVTDDAYDVASFVKPLIFAILHGTIFCTAGLWGWHGVFNKAVTTA